MRIFQRGNYWHLHFIDDAGQRHRHRFKTRVEARAFAKGLAPEAEAAKTEAPPKRAKTLEGHLILYRDARRLEFPDPENFRAFRYILNYFLDAMTEVGVTTVEGITPESLYALRAYWANAGLKASTINKRFSTINPFLVWCMGMDLLRLNPMAKIKPLPMEETSRELWTANDVRAILNEMKEEFKSLFVFIHSCGCRPKEACRITVSNIDFERGFVCLSTRKGGSLRKREIPLTKEMTDLLSRTIEERNKKFPWVVSSTYLFLNPRGRAITPVRLSDEVRRARRALGLSEGLIPYGLRHTLISIMAEKDIAISKIQAIAGHTRLETTKRYTHLKDESLRGVLKSVQDDRDKGNVG